MYRNAIPGWADGVIRAAAMSFGVLYSDMLRGGRLPSFAADGRAAAVYCARSCGNGTPSFPELGRYFGKDYSTLIQGDKKFRARLKWDTNLRRRVDAFLQQNNEGNETCHIGEVSGQTRDTLPLISCAERTSL